MAPKSNLDDTLKKRFSDYKKWRDDLIVVIGKTTMCGCRAKS